MSSVVKVDDERCAEVRLCLWKELIWKHFTANLFVSEWS